MGKILSMYLVCEHPLMFFFVVADEVFDTRWYNFILCRCGTVSMLKCSGLAVISRYPMLSEKFTEFKSAVFPDNLAGKDWFIEKSHQTQYLVQFFMNQIKHPIRVFLKKPQLRTLEKGTLGYDSHLAFRYFSSHKN